MSNSKTKEKDEGQKKSSGGFFASAAIILCLVTGWCVFLFVFGNPNNFEGGDNHNQPLPGNYLGLIYKGGYVVPFLLTLFLVTMTFTIERFFTINKAKGKGNIQSFVRKVQYHLETESVDSAISECDKQRGSVANVTRATLETYKKMLGESDMDKEQKVIAIRQEVEEATALELPILEKNLVILATMGSVATLVALFGTVLGMIKAFAALATAGAPDPVALANGISEALINTALGIGTAAIAIIFYNYFTTKIDNMTYAIDELSFSIANTFAAKHK
jgi:biopolymer transport protein ExbB